MKSPFLVLSAVASFLILSGCELQDSAPRKPLLNYYNTSRDDYRGDLITGETYEYRNRGVGRNLRFTAMQVLYDGSNAHLTLFYRGDGHGIKSTVFVIFSERGYVTDAALREEEYVCCGTYTYETKAETSKTVYAFAEKDFYEKNKEAIKVWSNLRNENLDKRK